MVYTLYLVLSFKENPTDKTLRLWVQNESFINLVIRRLYLDRAPNFIDTLDADTRKQDWFGINSITCLNALY